MINNPHTPCNNHLPHQEKGSRYKMYGDIDAQHVIREYNIRNRHCMNLYLATNSGILTVRGSHFSLMKIRMRTNSLWFFGGIGHDNAGENGVLRTRLE